MDAFPTSPEERAALVARFEVLNTAHESLYERIVEALPEDQFFECAEHLGLIRAGEILLEDDYDAEALTEYALHIELRTGGTFLSSQLEAGFAEAGSDDELLLRGMAEARFSFFEVVEVVPGLGAELRDLLRRSRTRIVLPDPEGMEPGIHFAGRVMDVENMTLLAGSILPVPKELALAMLDTLRTEGSMKPIAADAREPAWVSTTMIEAIVDAKRLATAKPKEPVRSTKIGRNEPCPCGSGKKYKKCCA